MGRRIRLSLDRIKSAGASGIVTALHHIYRGEAWPLDEVLKRKVEIEAAALDWSVVESIPVHHSIKLRSGPYRKFIDAWKDKGPNSFRGRSSIPSQTGARDWGLRPVVAGASGWTMAQSHAYAVHVPGGYMGYPAFRVRDSVMMLEGDFIELAQLEEWIRLMSSVLSNKDWKIRPGVVVPAFAVPDHIDLDGKASYYPGNNDTGTKQGGDPFGKYPPLNNQFYYLFAVYYQWKKSGRTLFRAPVRTAFGEMRLAELCKKGLSHGAERPWHRALCQGRLRYRKCQRTLAFVRVCRRAASFCLPRY